MSKSKTIKIAKPDRDAPAAEPTTLDEEMETFRSRSAVTSPQQKVFVVILIDGSGSMVASGALMLAIKAGGRVFLEAVGDVALATQAEIGVFSYHDGVVPLRELGPHGDDEIWDVGAVDASRISGGSTKSARALNHVFGLIEKRRAELSEEGIPVRAAFVVVLTDGHANDAPADTQAAIAKRKQLEARKDVRVFGIAVGEQADMVQLNELCGPPLALAGMSSFDHLWKWIFQTARTATATRPNDEIEMSNPIAGPANETGFAKHWLRY